MTCLPDRSVLVRIATALVLVLVPAQVPAAETLEGQVLCCLDCWTEADRTRVEYGTASDLAAAQGCIAHGDPTLLAVRDGDAFSFYRLEERKYRLPGKSWLELVGSRVRITGETAGSGESRKIAVDTLEVLTPSLAARSSAGSIGSEAALELRDLSGAQQSLAGMRGRIVVLNFWATWCAPCKQEMPDLSAVQNRYAALGVQVIGAAADEAADKPRVLQFVREVGINFPVWLGATTADMLRHGLTGALPGTVILGKDGKVAKIYPGVVKEKDLAAQLDAMLEADAASSAEEERARARGGDESADSAQVSSVPS